MQGGEGQVTTLQIFIDVTEIDSLAKSRYISVSTLIVCWMKTAK